MRRRFSFLVALAMLAGLALAVVAPAQPSAADDVNCYEVFVVDPTLCDDDIPPEPPAPRPPSMTTMGGMQETPGTVPGMMPNLPGEVCDITRTFASPVGIIQPGVPDVFVYTFTVRTDFCVLAGVITKARVSSSLDVADPLDQRIQSITGPFTSSGPNGLSSPQFTQTENVVTEFCPDGVNCQRVRHIMDVTISGRSTPNVVVRRDIFDCAGAACGI